MDIGVVGLPRSGKTTVFNAVTRASAQLAAGAGARGKPNLAVAKVPDTRMEFLETVFNPKKNVRAEVTYVDFPAEPEGLGTTRGISGEYLNHLQSMDALLLVVRAFDEPSVPGVDDTVDPFRDAETMAYELAFSDLEILSRRLTRVAEGFKGAKAPEREALNREQALLARIKQEIEDSHAVRDQEFDSDEARLVAGFQFLTAKPVIVVVNVSESQLTEAASLEERMSFRTGAGKVRVTAVSGKLEMELAEMDPADEKEFRKSMGLGESSLNRMIRLSQEVLDLVTFFTGNGNEVKAWPVPRGTTALQAAGRIHSDFERGFIRAEVVGFDDLKSCGSMAEARRRGLLHREGKTYAVKEGDVINILFNV